MKLKWLSKTMLQALGVLLILAVILVVIAVFVNLIVIVVPILILIFAAGYFLRVFNKIKKGPNTAKASQSGQLDNNDVVDAEFSVREEQ